MLGLGVTADTRPTAGIAVKFVGDFSDLLHHYLVAREAFDGGADPITQEEMALAPVTDKPWGAIAEGEFVGGFFTGVPKPLPERGQSGKRVAAVRSVGEVLPVF